MCSICPFAQSQPQRARLSNILTLTTKSSKLSMLMYLSRIKLLVAIKTLVIINSKIYCTVVGFSPVQSMRKSILPPQI